MTKFRKVHLVVILTVNLALVVKMISVVWEGSDKEIILLMLGYPLLIFLNALVWLILRLLKSREHEIYKIATLGLLALFIPTLIISSLY